MSPLPDVPFCRFPAQALRALFVAALAFSTAVGSETSRFDAMQDHSDSKTQSNAGMELIIEDENPTTRAFESSPVLRKDDQITIPARRSQDKHATFSSPWYRNGVVALAIVLAMIGVVAWLGRKVTATSAKTAAESVQVCSRAHLSPKQSIALVRLGARFVFVGVTPDRISLLREVDSEEETALLVAKTKRRGQIQIDSEFSSVLAQEGEQTARHLESAIPARDDKDRLDQARKDVNGLLTELRARHSGRRVTRPAAHPTTQDS